MAFGNAQDDEQAFQGQGEDVVYGLGSHDSDFGDLMRGEKDLNNQPEEAPMERLTGGVDNTAGNRGSGDPTSSGQGTSTKPREGLPGSNGNISSTPAQSSSPRAAQASMSVNRGEGENNNGRTGGVGNNDAGVIPFNPLPAIGKPGAHGSRLFGALGGLQGGGIGVPHAVGYNETGQQDISQLMAMLQRKRGLF